MLQHGPSPHIHASSHPQSNHSVNVWNKIAKVGQVYVTNADDER